MSLEPAVHSRSSANGFGRRRGEREMGTRLENKSQSGKSNAGRKLTNAGSKSGSYENSPSRDRLVYLSTCTIGNQVEVQLKNGDIYSGIFHATNAEKDFGVILKMARMIKDGGSRGQKSSAESLSRAPLKTIIIHSKELVQVIAKQVSISRDGSLDDIRSEKQKELMIDSHISQSRHVEAGRELAPWVPDEDVPQRPELENIFDGPWKSRGWDQFRANEALFGVKSTFDEELYTTKLERGSLTREREKEAQRIAREIEGEETLDLHLAEERGLPLSENSGIDDETRFSSVNRGKAVDDSSYEENEDVLFDTHNDETFGGSSESVITSSADWTNEKRNDVARVLSSSSAVDQAQSSQSIAGVDLSRSGSYDHTSQLASESLESSLSTASESRINKNQPSEQGVVDEANEFVEKQALVEEAQMSKYDDSQLSLMEKKDNSDKGLSPNANSNASSHVSSKGHEKSTSNDLKGGPVPGKTQTVNSHGRPGSSVSSSSDGTLAASAPGPGLSPSSSMGSMSSEKSTLNPHAKEFKLNPNAKSFVPSPTPVRPPSPVADGSYYFPHNMPGVPQMPSMPVGIGINHSFAHQHVMYPQAGPLQAPQTYFHPNQSQYQQMIMGQHRPVLYMPNYQPEMPYKGREY
ncbi:hypothetical protein UlMin_011969 [Ulmus minor]